MSKPKVLFFVRSHSHWHALAAIALIEELKLSARHLEIVPVSFGPFTFWLGDFLPNTDRLALSETVSYNDILAASLETLARHNPVLVIAYEEFAILAAARIRHIKALFIGAVLPAPGSVAADCLRFATMILVTAEPGTFKVPGAIRDKTRFVGFLHRKVGHTVQERDKLRDALHFSRDALIVLVASDAGEGSEAYFPMAEPILSAFLKIEAPEKHLLWMSYDDSELLGKRLIGIKGVQLMNDLNRLEELMCVANVVIAKGARGMILDAGSMGVPSIVLCTSRNPRDELFIRSYKTEAVLNLAATDGEGLLYYISKALAADASSPAARPPPERDGFADLMLVLRGDAEMARHFEDPIIAP